MGPTPLDESQQRRLLQLALASIRHGLAHGSALTPRLEDYPAELRDKAATFVTLHLQEELRGCIGNLEPRAPLVASIAENAWSAAFRDPRFSPLQAQELEGLDIHISILSPAKPMEICSEAELLEQLRPGIDGLILEETGRRATFLPSVWEELPRPRDFVRALKRKAGIPAEHWSDQMRASRYQSHAFGALVKDLLQEDPIP